MNARRTSRQASGFTLTELVLLICIFAILIALLLPALFGPKKKAKRSNCVANLKQINVGFWYWARDNGDQYPMQVVLTNSETLKLVTNGNAYLFWQIMSNELSTPKILHCPADERRTNALSFTQGFSDVNISYFFSLDATTMYPQMILTGDDNLAVDGVPVQPGLLIPRPNRTLSWTDERHRRMGNIGMADGSVQQVTSNGLNTVFAVGFNASTNITSARLVIP